MFGYPGLASQQNEEEITDVTFTNQHIALIDALKLADIEDIPKVRIGKQPEKWRLPKQLESLARA